MSPLILALSGWGIMIAVMALLWLYQYKGGDAGIVLPQFYLGIQRSPQRGMPTHPGGLCGAESHGAR